MTNSFSHEIDLVFPDLPPGDFWVFAYGSLMWRPDFEFTEKRDAFLQGYMRSLCVWSWHHRGTRENPGLVFGLDQSSVESNAECHGCVYHVSENSRIATLENLKDRELITDVYQPAILEMQTSQGRIQALTFIVDKTNQQYAGNLDLDHCVEIICRARGKSGLNIDYVLATRKYLEDTGIRDDQLRDICERLNLAK